MPQYFIDMHDGAHFVRDRDGYDLPDIRAARKQAARILTRVTQGLNDVTERQDCVLAVRDVSGAVRLRLRMSLDPNPMD